MGRRRFLIGAGLGIGAIAGTAAWRWWPDQGLWNPCLAGLPRHLAEHELVRAAWEGIDPAQVWDVHAHLIGVGDSGSGIEVNPALFSPLHPLQFLRRSFFMNAGCVHEAGDQVDRRYVARLRALANELAPGAKLLLFAFDRSYDVRGHAVPEQTAFAVPDAYARAIAQAHPQQFEWVASIHPYRSDAIEALERARRDGARAVKWLPAAMGMDPAAPACDRFYGALARLDLPLISHAGRERAVHGADTQEYGNPLRLRRALDAGVRVIVAHCASMGEDRDLDRGPDAAAVSSFELFARLMDEPRYRGRLFADLSAMPQRARAATLARVLVREDWHERLLNGSDYPLPGVMPLYSLDQLVGLGVLDPGTVPILSAIRRYNPLLFDFVLKRQLRSAGKRFPPSVFQTRNFFDPASRSGG